jgi:hypothetical protein
VVILLRKRTERVEKSALVWNIQGVRRCGRPKNAWKRLSRKKPWKWGRHGAKLKGFLLRGTGGSVSQTPYAPEEATGIDFYYINAISR